MKVIDGQHNMNGTAGQNVLEDNICMNGTHGNGMQSYSKCFISKYSYNVYLIFEKLHNVDLIYEMKASGH